MILPYIYKGLHHQAAQNFAFPQTCRRLWREKSSTPAWSLLEFSISVNTGWWFGTFIFHILGIIIPIDFHIFSEGLKPPTRYRYIVNTLETSKEDTHLSIFESTATYIDLVSRIGCWITNEGDRTNTLNQLFSWLYVYIYIYHIHYIYIYHIHYIYIYIIHYVCIYIYIHTLFIIYIYI